MGAFEAGNGTRTRDLLLGKQTLYQLSYTREAVFIIKRGGGCCQALCYNPKA